MAAFRHKRYASMLPNVNKFLSAQYGGTVIFQRCSLHFYYIPFFDALSPTILLRIKRKYSLERAFETNSSLFVSACGCSIRQNSQYSTDWLIYDQIKTAERLIQFFICVLFCFSRSYLLRLRFVFGKSVQVINWQLAQLFKKKIIW